MRFVHGGWVGRAGLGAALALALAGCTGEPAPIVTELPSEAPSATAAPSATPSPSVTPLTDAEVLALLPEGAERTDLWGAMVTAQAFAELAGRVFETNELALWDALGTERCEYCSSQYANVVEFQSSGLSATGGAVTIDPSSIRASLDGDARAFVTFDADVEPIAVLAVDGSVSTPQPALLTMFTISLENDGAVWRVDGVRTDSEVRE